MVDQALTSPFGDEAVEEVPLARAPLARVLAQVRFPRLAALASGAEAANAYAAAMRNDYPILEEEREVGITFSPAGAVTESPAARSWKLRSADEQWQLSVTDTFLTIDTASYVDREDFAARLDAAWQVFLEVVQPPFTERLGVRYINRIVDVEELNQLSAFVRPEVLGGLGLPFHNVALVHSISQSLYALPEQRGLQARWGLLPPGGTLDPAVEPVETAAWVLDLDSFRNGKDSNDPALISSQVRELADRAYRYFRWVVTPAFLSHFGGRE